MAKAVPFQGLKGDGRLFVSMLLMMVPQRIQQQADEIRKYNETDEGWSVKYKRCIKNDGR